MRERLASIGVVLCVMAVPAGVLAQEGGVVRLTLEEAQGRARAASHRLAEVRARESAAQAAADARDAARRPLVSASAGYTRTNHVTEFVVPSPTGAPRVLYPDVPDNYRTRLDLQWALYTGGRTDALERAARAEAAAVGADVAVAQADLRLEVARSFWAVVTADATVSVLEQGVARAQAHERDVRVTVLPRDEAFAIPDLIRTKVNLLPPGIDEIRTIEIVGLDLQADGGTHVANTREVGAIRVTGYESKGRINKRIRIALEDT